MKCVLGDLRLNGGRKPTFNGQTRCPFRPTAFVVFHGRAMGQPPSLFGAWERLKGVSPSASSGRFPAHQDFHPGMLRVNRPLFGRRWFARNFMVPNVLRFFLCMLLRFFQVFSWFSLLFQGLVVARFFQLFLPRLLCLYILFFLCF